MTAPMQMTPVQADAAAAPEEYEEVVGSPVYDEENLLDLVPQEDDDPDTAGLRDVALSALYGPEFPLVGRGEQSREEILQGQRWVTWAQSLWSMHRAGVDRRLHLVERNRRFRDGDQWISSYSGGPWREPPRPRDAARIVDNRIAPALDLRCQINSEQRPGFRTRPRNQDPEVQKRAEAQQMALEFQYDQQGMPEVIRETSWWSGTDAVAFWELCWDPERGPWSEVLSAPLGDVRTETLRIEQVRVSANATATRKPSYWVIRRVIAKAEAVKQYGDEVAREVGDPGDGMASDSLRRQGYYDNARPEELLRDQETVDEWTVYCERSEYLPRGLTFKAVGNKAVFLGPLLCGVVPMVRVPDGTTDPAFFPRAQMEQWLDDQIRINALESKWVESIRKNADGRLLTRAGSVVRDTLVGGMLSVIEVKNPEAGPLGDVVQPMPGFSVGTDTKELLALTIKSFEEKSGYNDAARGSISSSASGRAILAIREQLERMYAPGVNAIAQAMTEWGKINLHWMRWGYDLPRTIGISGRGRIDLAIEVTAEDFNGVAEVEIDPETLMPLPRPLRMFLLEQMLANGSITPEEYRRRMPFAFVQNLDTPDTDHYARAKRVALAIKTGQQVPPIRWQDNEAIHQDVLEREIILNDDLDPRVIQLAEERWITLANQAAQKAGVMQQPQPGAPGGGGQPPQLPPTMQPLPGTNPGMASAPAEVATASDQAQAAGVFEMTAPQ